MKNITNPLFYFGPMSINIVDAVCEFYNNQTYNVGFIPSRRQVECKSLGSGYVNGWSSESFSKYVKDKNIGIVIERDHSGPLQGLKNDDGTESLLADIDSKFDIIHIDPWKKFKSVERAADVTSSLIKMCIEKNTDCMFEVGTEEGIRKYSVQELEYFLTIIEKDLGKSFSQILYGVVQSGTNVSGLSNTGKFNFKNSKEMCKVCTKFGLIPKEHNSDYLSVSEIKERMSAGVESFNIAPEMGVLETTTILNKLKELKLEERRNNLIALCVNSQKWKKWVEGMSTTPDNETIARICGHYIFSSSEFVNIKSDLARYTNINADIKNAIKSRLEVLSCLEK